MKLLICLVLLLCMSTACAHPGGTDSAGGHTDRSIGEYHYHHGYSAHQHENGTCPYDFVDKSGENSGSSSTSSSSNSVSFLHSNLKVGDHNDDVKKLQNRLNDLGYSCGTADGIFGTKTESAVKAYQADQRFLATGIANYVTMCRLFPEITPTPTPMPTSTPVPTNVPNYKKQSKLKSSNAMSSFSKSDAFPFWIIFISLSIFPIWGAIDYLYASILKSKNRAFIVRNKSLIDANKDLRFYIEGKRMHSTKDCILISEFSKVESISISYCQNYPALPCPNCMTNSALTKSIAEQREAAQCLHVQMNSLRNTNGVSHQHTTASTLVYSAPINRKQYIKEKVRSFDCKSVTEDVALSGAVYISENDDDLYFHNSIKCAGYMDTILVYRKSAQELGLKQCPKCSSHAQPDVMVAVSPRSKTLYHDPLNNCISADTKYLIRIDEAHKRGLTCCCKCLSLLHKHYPLF